MQKAIVIVVWLFLNIQVNAQTLSTVTATGNTTTTALRLSGEGNVGSSGAAELVLGLLTTPRTNDTRAFIGWKNNVNTITNGLAGTLLLQGRSDIPNLPIDFVTGQGTPLLRMRIAGNGGVVIGNNLAVPTSRLMVTGAGATNATTTFLLQNSLNTDLLKVLDNGNIGIGTTTAINEKIHIQDGNLLISSTGSVNTVMGTVKIAQAGYPNAYAGIAGKTNGGGIDQLDLLFYTAFGTASEKMRIMANTGFVGIGTATPNARLDVNGNIFTNGQLAIGTTDMAKIGTNALAVNGTAIFNKAVVKSYAAGTWPDYVFEKGYELLPLSDLRTYLQQNKHLPDVPAATTIEKDGIDLGGNQAILLKKIEELTLYILELNKRIDQQQTEINNLKHQ